MVGEVFGVSGARRPILGARSDHIQDPSVPICPSCGQNHGPVSVQDRFGPTPSPGGFRLVKINPASYTQPQGHAPSHSEASRRPRATASTVRTCREGVQCPSRGGACRALMTRRLSAAICHNEGPHLADSTWTCNFTAVNNVIYTICYKLRVASASSRLARTSSRRLLNPSSVRSATSLAIMVASCSFFCSSRMPLAK